MVANNKFITNPTVAHGEDAELVLCQTLEASVSRMASRIRARDIGRYAESLGVVCRIARCGHIVDTQMCTHAQSSLTVDA